MNDVLLIVGAGGHGKVVADIANQMSKWKKILFLDDEFEKIKYGNTHVIGKLEDAYKYKEAHDFFIAIGNNHVREKVSNELLKQGCKLATIIHPKSIIGSEVKIGVGTVVMPGVVINNNCNIGIGCIINTSSSIDHDCIIDDYVHISPGVRCGGSVRVGKSTWLGIGSIVINNVFIINDCIIGAAGLVIHDVNVSGTYVGIPIKRLHS
jgi:sugar O-acyltransferase (sialic acid O-acetyltransferase NeuD family)